MVTDELMEVLKVIGEMVDNQGSALIERITDLFSDFDDYVWSGMGEQERRNWVEEYINI